MARTRAPAGQGDTQDTRQKRPRAPPIRWCEADIQAIVTWVGKRNEKGVAVNYGAWTTGYHGEEAGRLLQETGLEGKEGVTKKKAADKLADMVKSYKNMRETANRTGWGTEEAEHKQQELNSEAGSTVKDHILKKCPRFYEFEDIFHKHPTISPPILIESEQPARRDGVSVNDSELGGFDFDLEEPLEADGEVEDTEFGLSLGNHDGNDNSDSDLHSVFSQIARDERRNEIQRANADQEKELEGMTKPLGSDTPSESESESAIAFAPTDVPHSTQPSYLQSRRDRLESETPARSNSRNQERLQKNNRPNARKNDKEPTQTSSRKRNHDRTRQFSSTREESSPRQLSPEPRDKKRVRGSKLSMAEAMAEETRLNHQRLMENAKDNREQAKEDREERREQVEYDRRQRDQHHEMEMARHQAILNQGEEKLLRLRMSLQRSKGHSSKRNNDFDLEEDSDA
ncbi:hypothetical protein MMC31_005845 [Peltigera leucophlebia]|nr:hypothetical protein [Peltigera leucophlebia]